MNQSLGRQATDRRRLIDVALGREPADLVFTGGTLVNTFTAELLPGWGVAVAGDRIAAVGDTARCIGDKTEVVNATGLYVAPGFFDPHYHIESSRLVPARHAEVTVPYGLTTLLEDPHEACAVIGTDGVRFFMDQAADVPQRILLSVSSATPPTDFETTGGYIGPDEFREMLTWDNVQGLGEVMDPPRLFNHDSRLWGMISHAEAMGRRVEGHGGFVPPEVDAFAAAGMGSTHSPRSVAEAVEMVRRGLYLQLQVDRAGDIVPALMAAGMDLSNVGLAVDDRTADQLLQVGPINFEVRRLIELGIPAARAYQMASFNNARYWRLDGEIGVLAPGRYADILLISDLKQVTVDQVFLGGRLVARQGRLIVRPTAQVPAYARNTVRLAGHLTPEHFHLPAQAGTGAEARAMVLKPGYYGRDMDVLTDTLPVIDGLIQPSPIKGITKAAVIDRHQATGNVGLGFWRLGLQEGAIAFTVLHDSHNLCVVGTNDDDMAVAANHVAGLHGGIAIVRNGEVLADLPLPVLGLMSEGTLEEVSRRQATLDEIGLALGLDPTLLGPHPVDRLTFLFLTCHPRKYQLTDQGLFDVATGQRLPVQVG